MKYLAQCQNKEEGGFAGAPYHQSHIASTYAAILAVVNIGTEEAYEMVDVHGMERFLLSVKNNHSHGLKDWQLVDQNGQVIVPQGVSQVNASLPGSVEIHKNGEIDMRGIYCTLVVADILSIMSPTLTQ